MKKENRKNILKRLVYTILILFIYDLLTYVTIPGVDPGQIAKLAETPALTMLSMFSGGGFQSLSILSLGVSAYISAQIIVQLLQSNVVPKLTEWGKQGQVGREKLNQFTRWLTVVLGFVQALGIIAGVNTLSDYGIFVNNSAWNYTVVAILMTTGTFIALWLADQISTKGLGNGISVIIAAGIIKRLPDTAYKFYLSMTTTVGTNWDLVFITVITLIFLITLIILINRSEYRIDIQYSRRENKTSDNSYLPFKVIVPGVVPVIFASSILTIPQTILMFFQTQKDTTLYKMINDLFSLNSVNGAMLYTILIITFTYLYSLVQIEPERLAENLSKQDAYIPGIYPGDLTAVYVKNILYDLGLPGSIFLASISVVPLVAANTISPSLQMGLSGSSLLILVGVIADISRQIEGLKLKYGYPEFLSIKLAFQKED